VNCRTETANAKYPRSAGAVVPFALRRTAATTASCLSSAAPRGSAAPCDASIGFFGGVGREFLQLEELANLDLAVLITVGNVRQID